MTPYTIRPVFWAHKINKQGTGPIMIAVTINRKVTYFKTAYRIYPGEWKENKVVNSNAILINRNVRQQMDEIEAELLAHNAQGEPVSVRSIKRGRVLRLEDFVKEIKKNKPAATRRRYDCEAGRFKNFGGKDLLLAEITTAFLRNYEAHERSRGMAQNTLNTTIRWIKAILNKAYKEKLIKEVPHYVTPKYIQTERVFLTEDERAVWLKYWREKKVDGSLYTTLTWFLVACYTGLRYSDWAQFDYNKRVEGDFFRLRAKKNGRWVVLPIGPTLRELIEVAKDLPGPVSADKTREHLKILAGRVECKKAITTHVARHTACAMFAQLGLPKAVCSELLGISEKVVSVYFHLSGRDVLEQAAILKKI